MKYLLTLLLSTSVWASSEIVIDIPQTEVSHPELIRLDYVLIGNPPVVQVRARANGREYRSIIPQLKVIGSTVVFSSDSSSTICGRIDLFSFVTPLPQNCSFKISSERVSHGPLDPSPRDVFRVYLITH